MKTKGLSWFFILLIIGNFLLFIFDIIGSTIFWIIIILTAGFAYKVLPNLKNKFK